MKNEIYKITHRYSKRPEYSLKVISRKEQDLPKIAGYIQVFAEEFINPSIVLGVNYIVDILVKFYDCYIPNDEEFIREIEYKNIIDMYLEREWFDFEFLSNMKQHPYFRDGLLEYLKEKQKNGVDLETFLESDKPKYYTDFEYFKKLSTGEQKYIFNTLRYKMIKSEEAEAEHFDELSKYFRFTKESSLTLQIVLLYLFNKSKISDHNHNTTLIHFIQDCLINGRYNTQPEDIRKQLERDFQGDLTDNTFLISEIERILCNTTKR
ncbi:hypothetical protein QJU11_10000 [Pasteurella atlantica]|uniref:hypothetical protein n=1 Tax=Phocoenobacter atlanticus TaxID=3416742 RepID=UPI002762004E|nr:hypothetical protein [Pasteurella atlantica]MDP8042523.1 hypothetical protein [Pasteurella atlantica]